MKQKRPNMNKGAAGIFVIFGLLFFILFARILIIQITGQVDGKVLAAKAAQKYMRSNVIEASRGTIYDRNGDVVAEDVPSYTLIAILDKRMTVDPKDPKNVVDPRMTAAKLSTVINMPEDEIYNLLTKKGVFQVEFGKAGKNLSYDTMTKIEALNLPGITFMPPEAQRFYPNGSFAAHVIGYAQSVEDKNGKSQLIGEMGLEKSLDQLLRGYNGRVQYEGDMWGYIIPGSKKKVQKPKNGDNVYLTIDDKIQNFIEDALDNVQQKYHPAKMIAVVADPKTGKILGMGQRPTFDPSTRDGLSNSWHNEAVETTFEPGSTMKIFTLSTAVQQGVFDPNEKYNSGKFYVKGVPNPIKDYNYGVGWGKITYLEGLQRSSNVAFSSLLDKIGQSTFLSYLHRFHFGQPTNIDLPNEASGQILYKYPIERYTTTFGQGTSVTAMQMVQAATAVANNGKMMKPYVIDKIVDPNTGKVKQTKPEVVGNPISAETAKTVRGYLRDVVSKKPGTGMVYDIPGYQVIGKTGTAQMPNPNGGGYLKGWSNYVFSFLGMAPENDPKLLVYVVVQQPHLDQNTLESGSTPVKMIFDPVMKSSLQYLNIKPDTMPSTTVAKIPDSAGLDVKEAVSIFKKSHLDPVVLGKGNTVVSQSPNQGEPLLEGEKVFIKTDGQLSVPDMTGWSKRDVISVSEMLGLKLSMNGEGYAVSQNLSPKSPVHEGDPLEVSFQTPEAQSTSGKNH
jgi:penicillin-binding protein 2B